MRKTFKIIALIAGLLPALAAAQVPNFPQTLPANTVVGRLGIGPGPSQPIPFLVFAKYAFASATVNGIPLAGGFTLAAGTSMTVSTVGSTITFSGQTIGGGDGIAVSTASSTATVRALGPWRIVNLRADNNAGFPSLAMDMTADAAVFYNPSTGAATPIVGASNFTKTCGINSSGAGGRDQSAAFTTGQVIWFYYINGTSGTHCTISTTSPTSGGPSFSLLTGYSRWAPAFPLPLVGSATLNPLIPQGGSTQFQVRGSTVSYPNLPEMIGAGYPTINFNLSTWVPAIAKHYVFMIDAEIHSSAGGAVIGGAVPYTALGNFGNISLYPPAASTWYAQDPDYSLPLPGGTMSLQFSAAAGTIDQAIGEVWIRGYTFSNGGD